MNPFKQKQISMLISMLFFFLLACNATFSVGNPTATLPVPTTTITETPAPLISQQVILISVPFDETNLGTNFPTYTITSQTPQLTGSDDPRVLVFNQRLHDLIANEVDIWRQSFQQLPLTSISNGSYLNVTYTPSSQMMDLWSFKFDFAFYADSAAHPGLNSITLNYDLGQGKELTLGDLFLPDANYLETISKHCITELSKQPFFDGPFTDGANPTIENYRNWTLSPDGVTITFDAYQVAPGAAGPQQVVVPFGQLQALIDPQGPLKDILQ